MLKARNVAKVTIIFLKGPKKLCPATSWWKALMKGRNGQNIPKSEGGEEAAA